MLPWMLLISVPALFSVPPTRVVGSQLFSLAPTELVNVLLESMLMVPALVYGLSLLTEESTLARSIHEYLLRRPTRRPEPLGGVPILSPGGAFLVRPPRRTANTPMSALLARSPGGLRSRTPRDGIQ